MDFNAPGAQSVLKPLVEAGNRMWALMFSAFTVASATAQSATNLGLASVNGVYNSSTTPSSLPWNTYNYCNAPHVVPARYTLPSAKGAKLVYVNTVIRHHKVCRTLVLSSIYLLTSIILVNRERRITCIPKRTC